MGPPTSSSFAPPSATECATIGQKSFPHRVFVYGTLKRGFFNHDAVMVPKPETWRLVSDQACLRLGPESAFFVDIYYTPYLVIAATDCASACKKTNTTADTSTTSSKIIEDTSPILQQKDEQQMNMAPQERERGETRMVRGEVYEVSDEMLADLDDLEGVKFGRYTRSEVAAEVMHGAAIANVVCGVPQMLGVFVYLCRAWFSLVP